MSAVDQLKEEGNTLFKKEDYKAAAIAYTKAIKDASFASYENKHVLYSNRSAAFLGMAKHQGALQDAVECIQQKPDWPKGIFSQRSFLTSGYYRKAKALEALGKKDELLEALNAGLTVDPKNKDLLDILKVSFPQQYKQRHAQQPKPVPTPAPKKEDGLFTEEVMLFAQGILTEIRHEFEKDPSLETVMRAQAYLLPKSAEEEQPVIAIERAFAAPETLAACTDYIRDMVKQTSAKAALLVAQKSTIAYPQNWKNKTAQQWNFSPEQDGIFVQLETKETPNNELLRVVHFLPLDKTKKKLSLEPFVLDADMFWLTQPLFK